jgi:aryl-alcohol dehydrogenase-like predicted oxidoreductase
MATAVGGERAIVVALVAASRLKRSDSAGRKETDMDMIRLGRTGLAVSVAGLGCGGHSRLGMARGATESDAVSIVRHALDLGVNFIDTARAYGTEGAVGKGIEGRREDVVLSTKTLLRGADGMITPDELVSNLEASLVALGTDHIDVFHLHGLGEDEYDVAVDTLVPALERQKTLGKIRFLGVTERFSNDTTHEMFRRALPDDLFDVVMVGFNLLNPSARSTVFPLTREKDVATLIMFAVRRALSQPEALAALLEEIAVRHTITMPSDGLDFVSDAAGVSSLVQAAYRFCRHEHGADVVLTGTGSKSHLDENVASILAPPLPDDITDRLAVLFGKVDSVSGN